MQLLRASMVVAFSELCTTRYLVQYLRPICTGAVLTTELFHFSGTIRHSTSAASSVVMYVRLHCHEA